MIKLSANELRKKWIEFFQSKNHMKLDPHSLVPQNDDSLLWINSGVAALKSYFSGEKKPPCNDLVNSQKAIRTNDIRNVGKTSRHHTFFEMLGNFSIGGYFKDKAIDFAYEFLVDVLKMEKDKLYITYYEKDNFTYEKWKKMGIEDDHLFKNGKDKNFWDLGSGPCGPDTEIFYDRGEKFDPQKLGTNLVRDDIENDRYIEIWNIVFSEFNNLGNGKYVDLNQKNIDTGAGLERIAAISQGCNTNFESDLFMPIIKKTERFCNFNYDSENYFNKNKEISRTNEAFKVIADHIRTICMSIGDGVLPSNISQGYVIRMLLRRAMRKGLDLLITKPFLFKLTAIVQKTLPIYKFDINKVSVIIQKEEEQFIKTIFKGRKLLEKSIKEHDFLDPKVAFKLYDTYGYPIELTLEYLSEKNIKLNIDEFNKLKEKHSIISKGEKQTSAMNIQIGPLQKINSKISEFVGYENLEVKSDILHLMNSKEELESVNGRAYVITKKTPFYATAGGQKYDQGFITQNNGILKILDIFKDKHGNHIHHLEGIINKNQPLVLNVDPIKRMSTARNHTATHLTFSALSKILGENISQDGSSLDCEKLHMDFTNNRRPTRKELEKVENQMKKWIEESWECEIKFIKAEDVESSGVVSLDKEDYSKYGTKLRTVKFGNFSFELCGGTHVKNTRELENYLITSLDSKKSGVFRLFAITGNKIVNKYKNKVISRDKIVIEKLIDNVKKMDNSYTYKYSMSITSIREGIEQVKNDFRIVRKKFMSVQNYDLKKAKLVSGDKNEYLVYFDFESPAKIKSAAGTLRQENPEKIIIIHTHQDNRDSIFITSKTRSSKVALKLFLDNFKGKGGGVDFIAQGSVKRIKNFEVIKEILVNA